MSILKPVLAATIGDVNISNIYNPASKIKTGSNIADIITGGGINLIDLAFFVAGIAFFINLVLAGINYIMSSGDPKKVQTSTSRLINGLLGIALVIFSFVIVKIITQMLGLKDLI